MPSHFYWPSYTVSCCMKLDKCTVLHSICVCVCHLVALSSGGRSIYLCVFVCHLVALSSGGRYIYLYVSVATCVHLPVCVWSCSTKQWWSVHLPVCVCVSSCSTEQWWSVHLPVCVCVSSCSTEQWWSVHLSLAHNNSSWSCCWEC